MRNDPLQTRNELLGGTVVWSRFENAQDPECIDMYVDRRQHRTRWRCRFCLFRQLFVGQKIAQALRGQHDVLQPERPGDTEYLGGREVDVVDGRT